MFSLTALGATTSRNPWMSSGSTSSSSHRIARWCGTILARPARYSVNVRGLIPVRLARVCTPSCRSSISPPSFVCFGYGRPAMAGSVRRLLRIFHQNAKTPTPITQRRVEGGGPGREPGEVPATSQQLSSDSTLPGGNIQGVCETARARDCLSGVRHLGERLRVRALDGADLSHVGIQLREL